MFCNPNATGNIFLSFLVSTIWKEQDCGDFDEDGIHCTTSSIVSSSNRPRSRSKKAVAEVLRLVCLEAATLGTVGAVTGETVRVVEVALAVLVLVVQGEVFSLLRSTITVLLSVGVVATAVCSFRSYSSLAASTKVMSCSKGLPVAPAGLGCSCVSG